MLTRRISVLVLAALCACGSASRGAPSTAADFVAALAEDVTAQLVSCGSWTPTAASDWLAAVYGLDPARLRANTAIGYDAATGRACLDAVARRTCNQAALEPTGPPLACLGALVGTVPLGGSCTSTSGYDCASFGWCRFDACNVPGTCMASDHALGASCAGIMDCARGLTCQGGQCQPAPLPPPVAPAGGGCLAAACPDVQYCDWSATCAARVPEGGVCDAAGPPCAWGTDCSSGRCARHLQGGDSCAAAPGSCPVGTFCAAFGACQAWPVVGQPCGDLPGTSGVSCARGWCDAAAGAAGSCAPYQVIGAPCTPASQECGPDGTCATGACEPTFCR